MYIKTIFLNNPLTSHSSTKEFNRGEDRALTAVRWRKWIESFNHLIGCAQHPSNGAQTVVYVIYRRRSDYRRVSKIGCSYRTHRNVDNIFVAAKCALDNINVRLAMTLNMPVSNAEIAAFRFRTHELGEPCPVCETECLSCRKLNLFARFYT